MKSNLFARSYQKQRITHWNLVAQRIDSYRAAGRYYQKKLSHYYRYFVPSSHKVLEIGCGEGDLLAALEPSLGVGVDFSLKMLNLAKGKYPKLMFICADAHEIVLDCKFDFIILSDLLNDLWDVQTVFENIQQFTHDGTRLIINSYSHLWEIPLRFTQWLGLSKPNLEQNWLTVDDITNLLHLTGFEFIRHKEAILFPLYLPLISTIANRIFVNLWPFSYGALTNFLIARTTRNKKHKNYEHLPTVSIVIPARNEEGNIEEIFARTPQLGKRTELIFVEGHSKDDTYSKIEECIEKYKNRSSLLIKQIGKGKGDAVRLGFQHAKGDILMILDADLTVPPEDLTRFYDALRTGKGEFINGVRLVYPLEHQSMRFLNKVGNKFFSLVFTWLLGQSIKDTLCGTKSLWHEDYQKILLNRDYFGNFDPFGDFDLLFGSSKLNLKIIELPIRYRARMYGQTNIDRWKHGWRLLKMVVFAARKMKFI